MLTSIGVKFPSSFSRDSSLCNCHPLSCIHLLFWPCFQAICRLFFLRKLVKVDVILLSSTKTAGLMQTRPENFSVSRPLFCRYPAVLLSFVILLDIAHVVAGYRELAKGFEPIRNEEIVSKYFIYALTIHASKLS